MPSWIGGELIGAKTVTCVPTNAGTPVLTVNAAYLLFDGHDGRLLAVLDGDELTARRTAAISAVAAALADLGLPARASTDLADSVRNTDIISCVTGATEPLVPGADLRPPRPYQRGRDHPVQVGGIRARRSGRGRPRLEPDPGRPGCIGRRQRDSVSVNRSSTGVESRP